MKKYFTNNVFGCVLSSALNLKALHNLKFNAPFKDTKQFKHKSDLSLKKFFINCFKGRKTLALSLVLGLVFSGMITWQVEAQKNFTETCDEIRSQSLRLHVVANSNTAKDQLLKLKVRDACLEVMGELYEKENIQTKKEAAELFARNTAKFNFLALEVLQKNSAEEKVNVSLQTEQFSTTEYDKFTLPAGEYLALRIELGESKGKNWWCVLYPEMCLAAVGNGYETEQQNEIVVGDYALRFAFLDWWEKTF